MAEVTLTINGQKIKAEDKDTILTAAAKNGIYIPSLCFLKDCNQAAACRICVVEVAGMRGLVPSCVTKVREGMEVQTENERIKKARRITLDMVCRHHRMICDRCERYSDCELHALCVRYGVNERDYNPYVMDPDKDKSSPYLIRDTSKCILCQRCVSVCREQGMDIISVLGRGREKRIAPPISLAATDCVGCGQCVRSCPTGALTICDDTEMIRNRIRQKKPDEAVIAVLMPAVGKTIGKLFYEKDEQDHTGKVVALLRKLGFDRVYSGELCQNIYLEAEKRELARRKAENGTLPMVSQACPGVEHLIRRQYPELEKHLSGIGTLQQYSTRLARTAYAEESGLSGEKIMVVCVNSCTAAKTLPAEKTVDETMQQTSGSAQMRTVNGESAADQMYRNLTTYELAAMFRRACVSRFTARKVWEEQLHPDDFDPLLTEKTILAENPQLSGMSVGESRESGEESCTAEITGLANVKDVLEKIVIADTQSANDTAGGESEDCIRGYACPGGCIYGGGAPRRTSVDTVQNV
ncbi:MAG: 2Fe-2S iron-sulfur cluster-binding protein [Lachnospiraceae bacterium]|nr:2Fe-2S iron-sulfur cluster-binding protein [Lachnospiraceae bacterium]